MFTELAAINFIFAQLDKFTSVKLPFCSIGFIKAIVVLIDNITTSIIAKEPNINNLYFLFINTNHPNHIILPQVVCINTILSCIVKFTLEVNS